MGKIELMKSFSDNQNIAEVIKYTPSRSIKPMLKKLDRIMEQQSKMMQIDDDSTLSKLVFFQISKISSNLSEMASYYHNIRKSEQLVTPYYYNQHASIENFMKDIQEHKTSILHHTISKMTGNSESLNSFFSDKYQTKKISQFDKYRFLTKFSSQISEDDNTKEKRQNNKILDDMFRYKDFIVDKFDSKKHLKKQNLHTIEFLNDTIQLIQLYENELRNGIYLKEKRTQLKTILNDKNLDISSNHIMSSVSKTINANIRIPKEQLNIINRQIKDEIKAFYEIALKNGTLNYEELNARVSNILKSHNIEGKINQNIVFEIANAIQKSRFENNGKNSILSNMSLTVSLQKEIDALEEMAKILNESEKNGKKIGSIRYLYEELEEKLKNGNNAIFNILPNLITSQALESSIKQKATKFIWPKDRALNAEKITLLNRFAIDTIKAEINDLSPDEYQARINKIIDYALETIPNEKEKKHFFDNLKKLYSDKIMLEEQMDYYRHRTSVLTALKQNRKNDDRFIKIAPDNNTLSVLAQPKSLQVENNSNGLILKATTNLDTQILLLPEYLGKDLVFVDERGIPKPLVGVKIHSLSTVYFNMKKRTTVDALSIMLDKSINFTTHNKIGRGILSVANALITKIPYTINIMGTYKSMNDNEKKYADKTKNVISIGEIGLARRWTDKLKNWYDSKFNKDEEKISMDNENRLVEVERTTITNKPN